MKPDELSRLADDLLDWHLERLDPARKEEIDAALKRDEDVRALCDRIGRTIQPLDLWSVPPPPANLSDRILDRVYARSPGPSTIPIGPVQDSARPVGRTFSLREIVAVAACIALLVGVVVPGMSALRRSSRRALCAENLGVIYQGTSAYQASFGGSLPFAGSTPGMSWLPTEGGGRRFASNSRHLYLLVKLDFGPTLKQFVCPSCTSDEPMSLERVRQCNDFANACNLSYASLNLSGPRAYLRPSHPIPYLSDPNPLFVNARFDPSVDPDRTNSRAHGGKGQTVLTLDGSTRWMTTPVYGVNRDNLWLAGNIRHYTGMEAPTSEDDAQLVPGYPTTDPNIARRVKTH